jgi:hypothetical protein
MDDSNALRATTSPSYAVIPAPWDPVAVGASTVTVDPWARIRSPSRTTMVGMTAGVPSSATTEVPHAGLVEKASDRTGQTQRLLGEPGRPAGSLMGGCYGLRLRTGSGVCTGGASGNMTLALSG